MYSLDCVSGAPFRPVTISFRIEIRLKDRLQQQLGGGLHYPVPNRGDAERSFAASRLWDYYPPHGLWLIRLVAKVLPDTLQPFLYAFRLDLLEALPIHARCAFVGLHQCVSMPQYIFAPDLVV